MQSAPANTLAFPARLGYKDGMPDAFDKLLHYLLWLWLATALGIAAKYAYITYAGNMDITPVFIFAALFDLIVNMARLFMLFLAVGTVCKIAGLFFSPQTPATTRRK